VLAALGLYEAGSMPFLDISLIGFPNNIFWEFVHIKLITENIK
jgi:hypothetical protein